MNEPMGQPKADMRHRKTPYAVLLSALALTFIATYLTRSANETHSSERFERDVERTRNGLDASIQRYLSLLENVRGLAAAKVSMRREQFHAYVEGLDFGKNYPAASGIGVAFRINAQQKTQAVQGLRAQGEAAFTIWPETTNSMFFPVVYLEPRDRFKTNAIGFDIFSDPLRRAAAERATRRGNSAATTRLKLLEEAGNSPRAGIVIYAPIYRNGKTPDSTESRETELLAFVFCSLRAEKVFQSAMGELANSQIRFRVFEGPQQTDDRLIFDSHPDAPKSRPTFLTSDHISFGGLPWTIRFATLRDFDSGTGKALPAIILMAGGLVSVSLFGVTLARTRAHTEMQRSADELRTKEERFRTLVEQSLVGIYVIQDGKFTYANPKLAAILSMPATELIGKPVVDSIAEEDRVKVSENIRKRMQGEVRSIQYSLNMLRKDGTKILVEVHGTLCEYDGRPAILGSLVDVSARHAAEMEIRRLNADLEQRVIDRTADLERANALARDSEARANWNNHFLESVLENLPLPVYIKDAQELRFVRINRATEDLTGYARDQLLGKSDRDFCPADEAERFTQKDRQVLSTGEVTDIPEETLHTLQKGVRLLHTRKVPIFDEVGHPKYILGVSEDITEQKAKEIELQRTRAVFESIFTSLPGLFLVLNPQLTIVAVSDAYLKATMTTREQLIGRGLFECFPDNPEDPKATGVSNLRASIDRVMETGESDTMAIQKYDVRRPDGVFEERFWSPINSPVFGTARHIEYVIHRVEDVTDFVRQKPRGQSAAESDALRARMEQMEAEIYHSAQAVQSSNQQLEAANKELEAFSYSISHDLRAPLRHIQGYVELLTRASEGQLSTTAQRYLKVVAEASLHMGQLIDDLLAFSRMSRVELHTITVDLEPMVKEIVRSLEFAIQGRHIEWKIDRLPKVKADTAMLRQVLVNLIGNAVKYSRGREPARIQFGAVGEEEGRIIFCVRDNGAGFDMKYVHKLFGVFSRLHSATEFEGTGIGLAIVRRIINRHGGRVWAESVIGEGAAIFFTLEPAKES